MSIKRERFAAVYLMIDWVTGTHYVGGARDYLGRAIGHRTGLRRNVHPYSKYFKKAFDTGTLTFFVLQRWKQNPTQDLLWKIEQEWANSFPKRINYCRSPSVVKGVVMEQTSRSKMSKAAKGRVPAMKGQKHSLKSRAKMSKSLRGRKHTSETKEKIRQSLLARPQEKIAEHVEKMRQANLGRVCSKAVRDKISASNRGKKRTPEQNERNRQAQLGNTNRRGKKTSEETRRKIRKALQHRGPVSKETREKLRQSALKQWSNQKSVKRGSL